MISPSYFAPLSRWGGVRRNACFSLEHPRYQAPAFRHAETVPHARNLGNEFVNRGRRHIAAKSACSTGCGAEDRTRISPDTTGESLPLGPHPQVLPSSPAHPSNNTLGFGPELPDYVTQTRARAPRRCCRQPVFCAAVICRVAFIALKRLPAASRASERRPPPRFHRPFGSSPLRRRVPSRSRRCQVRSIPAAQRDRRIPPALPVRPF